MKDAPMSDPNISADQVRAALRSFYHHRTQAEGDAIVRRILKQFGHGAKNVSALDPADYHAVYRAAGGALDGTTPLD
jgi:hypothetical protein